MSDKEHAHELLERLAPGQLAAVVHLLEVLARDERDELTDEDRRIIAESREYFRQGGEGLSFDQLLAECGFTMGQIKGSQVNR
jgi:hypothetical protein